MPKGRPQDYNVYGKASSGVKPSSPSAKGKAMSSSRNKGQRGTAMSGKTVGPKKSR